MTDWHSDTLTEGVVEPLVDEETLDENLGVEEGQIEDEPDIEIVTVSEGLYKAEELCV